MTMARFLFWLVAALGLCVAGCAQDVMLRDPATGRTAVCPGEYAPGGIPSMARVRAAEDQSDCVWRLQQRGFQPTQGG
jgi:hypothetical protein